MQIYYINSYPFSSIYYNIKNIMTGTGYKIEKIIDIFFICVRKEPILVFTESPARI